jgi:hypothetical protein
MYKYMKKHAQNPTAFRWLLLKRQKITSVYEEAEKGTLIQPQLNVPQGVWGW